MSSNLTASARYKSQAIDFTWLFCFSNPSVCHLVCHCALAFVRHPWKEPVHLRVAKSRSNISQHPLQADRLLECDRFCHCSNHAYPIGKRPSANPHPRPPTFTSTLTSTAGSTAHNSSLPFGRYAVNALRTSCKLSFSKPRFASCKVSNSSRGLRGVRLR